MSDDALKRISAAFPGRWDRNYVAAKLRTDPLYGAIAKELGGIDYPLLDVGCGIGLLAFFLRAKGVDTSIHGVDYDDRKIEVATQVATESGTQDVSFHHQDVRNGLPEHAGNVCILDILQFFDPQQQQILLENAAARVVTGGKLIVRSGLRDSSLRFKFTVLGDWLAKATRWMQAGPTHYPSSGDFHRILSSYGTVKISPLWGGTPFNNHLIVLTR